MHSSLTGRILATLGIARLMMALTLFVLATNAQAPEDTAARAKQEDAIHEAVLRYQMQGWSSDGDKHEREATDPQERRIANRLNSRVYFLSVNKKDPSDEFLKRFQDFPRTIKKASEGMQTKKFPGWVVDKRTKQPGIIFSADEIRWIKEDQVEVDGGYHCGGLCAAGDVFAVRLEHGIWKVVEARMKWIS